MKHSLPTLLLVLVVGLGMTAVPVSAQWTTPDCDSISGTYHVSFTTDEGLTLAWRKPSKPMFFTTGLAVMDEPNNLLAATETMYGLSIMRSVDAGCTWEPVLDSAQAWYQLSLTPAPGNRAYAWWPRRQLIFRIEGDSVIALSPPFEVLGLAVDPNDAMHIRVGTIDCQLYESHDGGVTFERLNKPANTGNTPIAFFTVEFSPHDWDCALCGTQGVWRTVNGGKSWKTVAPFNQADPDLIRGFAFSPTDPNRVWAQGTMQDETTSTRDVLISSDGGASFTSVFRQYDTAVDQNGMVQQFRLKNYVALGAPPGSPDLLYVPFGSYYEDYGTNLWRYDAASERLSVVHIDDLDDIKSITFNPADPSVMYLGLANSHATEEDVTDKLAAEKQAVAVSVAPNPFNPTANISFSLPSAAQVKLTVYNITGQKVGTLVNDYLSAGRYTFTWDGTKFASGMYLYRLQAGESVTTQKMILLK